VCPQPAANRVRNLLPAAAYIFHEAHGSIWQLPRFLGEYMYRQGNRQGMESSLLNSRHVHVSEVS
jgi:hypothetical protein